MAISAKDVKALREISGAGIMDCKKALQEVDGDIDAALEYLQKKGAAAAEKKATRTAAEGLVRTWLNDDQSAAVLVEVNCETDFVSRNDTFHALADKIVETIGVSKASSVEELEAVKVVGGDKTVADYLTEQIAAIGENIKVRRFVRYDVDQGLVGAYVHAGDQIGVLVQLKAPEGTDREKLDELARDVAMHVAAMNPHYLLESDIPAEDEESQREILSAQALEMGKPEPVVKKIVVGRMAKWRAENTLVSQSFVKNPDKTVAEIVDEVPGASLVSFARFEVGEGIEKDEKSLSEEVAEQLRGG